MTLRLVLVHFVRSRVVALSLLASAMLTGVTWWMVAGMEEPSAIRPLLAAFAMGMAFALGAQATSRHVERGIWYLPVSRRDVWRARWIFAAVVAPLFASVALPVPALVDRTAAATEAALLSVVYTFAYAALGAALVALATWPIPRTAPWRQLATGAASLADISLPLGLLLPNVTQQFHLARLPMQVTEIGPVFGTCLVLAIAAGTAAYFHTPPAVGREVRVFAPGAERRARRDDAPQQHADARAQRHGPWLSGLPLLLAHEYAWALLLASGFTVFAVVFVAGATKLWRSPGEFVALLRSVVRLFDGTPPAANTGIQAFALLVVFGIFAAALGTRLPLRLRHLRVLPVSAGQINALLVLWPAAIWLTAWSALLLLHYALLGTAVTSLHLAGLMAWVGATALVRAVMLRLSNATAAVLFAAMLLGTPFLLVVASPSPPVLAAFGVVWIASAAAINHAALRRNTIYRQPEFVLGVMPVPESPH